MYLVELTIVFSAERGGRDDQLLYESTTFKHRSRSINSNLRYNNPNLGNLNDRAEAAGRTFSSL